MKKKVDFFYVGSVRSGSTWLYEMLRTIPEFSLYKEDESYFFNDKYNENLIDLYEKSFRCFEHAEVRIDFSPTYSRSLVSLDRIFKYNPHAKFIFVYRKHDDLIYSWYKYQKSRLNTNMSFEYFWNSLAKDNFVFAEYLQKIYKLFGKENLLIVDFKLAMTHKRKYISGLFDFMGCTKYDVQKLPINKKINTSNVVPKNESLYKLLKKIKIYTEPYITPSMIMSLRRILFPYLVKEKKENYFLNDCTRKEILNFYKKDRDKIQKIIEMQSFSINFM